MSETGRLAVILNPGSGSVQNAEDIAKAISERLPTAELMQGRQAGDAERDARDAIAKGFDTIVVAGGDGTLNEVLNGVMEKEAARATLGLLPLGTGNDFARTLGVPLELEAALAIIEEGSVARLDVVRVTATSTRYFLNVSAGGFAGTVNEKMTPEIKANWGPLSYVRGMLEALPELSPYQVELTIDDQAPQHESAFNIALANARFVAKGVPIAPTAEAIDGLLDLVLVRETTLPRLALLVPQILAGGHLESEDVLHVLGRRIAIRATPPMTFNTDGEIFGDTPCIFEVLPKAVNFIVPTAAE